MRLAPLWTAIAFGTITCALGARELLQSAIMEE